MGIGGIGAGTVPQMKMPEAAESGPDMDGDGDEGGAAMSSAPVQAAPAPGTGAVVNKLA